MSSFESNCSMKKKEEEWTSSNKNKSKTSSSKNNKYNSKHNTKKTAAHTFYVSPIYATICDANLQDLLHVSPATETCPTNNTPHARAAIINDLITQLEVQLLWLLCPRFSQFRNDHSFEKVVVSRSQNIPVLLWDEK